MVVLLSKSFLDFVCLAGFLFPFYADELTTLIVRIKDEFPSARMNSLTGMDDSLCELDGCLRQGMNSCGIGDDICGGVDPSGMDGWMASSAVDGWKNKVVGAMGVLMQPHRRHLYQLLANEMRVDHWKVSVWYGLLQLVVGVSVLIVKPFGSIMVLSLLAVYFSGFVVLSFRFRKRLVN